MAGIATPAVAPTVAVAPPPPPPPSVQAAPPPPPPALQPISSAPQAGVYGMQMGGNTVVTTPPSPSAATVAEAKAYFNNSPAKTAENVVNVLTAIARPVVGGMELRAKEAQNEAAQENAKGQLAATRMGIALQRGISDIREPRTYGTPVA